MSLKFLRNNPTVFVILLVQVAGCSPSLTVKNQPNQQTFSSEENGLTKLESQRLPNAIRIHEKVISGGLPADDAAFDELSALGVKTIISVDGAPPDVEMAERHGLRYVHLPHGYDGISRERAQELAKAVRDLEGAVYVHCHHGKHRSPVAASVACVGAGLIPPSKALFVLDAAGTSRDYLGLYESANNAEPFNAELLDNLNVAFESRIAVPPVAQAMVEIEVTFHHLQQLSENQWLPTANHPDLVPAHETLILREHFAELLRSDETRQYPIEFSNWLKRSIKTARALEALLKSDPKQVSTAKHDSAEARITTADQWLNQISQDCTECHRAFRNVARDDSTIHREVQK